MKHQQKPARARRRIRIRGKNRMKFSNGGDEQIVDKTVDSGGKIQKKSETLKLVWISAPTVSISYFFITLPSIFKIYQFLQYFQGYLRRTGDNLGNLSEFLALQGQRGPCLTLSWSIPPGTQGSPANLFLTGLSKEKSCIHHPLAPAWHQWGAEVCQRVHQNKEGQEETKGMRPRSSLSLSTPHSPDTYPFLLLPLCCPISAVLSFRQLLTQSCPQHP